MTTTRPLTGVTGGGLPAEIWHEVMTAHQRRPARQAADQGNPGLSTYAPLARPGTGEGAVAPEDVPYFDGPAGAGNPARRADGSCASGLFLLFFSPGLRDALFLPASSSA
jgi:membrane peptidoglycan carboxypeptidase